MGERVNLFGARKYSSYGYIEFSYNDNDLRSYTYRTTSPGVMSTTVTAEPGDDDYQDIDLQLCHIYSTYLFGVAVYGTKKCLRELFPGQEYQWCGSLHSADFPEDIYIHRALTTVLSTVEVMNVHGESRYGVFVKSGSSYAPFSSVLIGREDALQAHQTYVVCKVLEKLGVNDPDIYTRVISNKCNHNESMGDFHYMPAIRAIIDEFNIRVPRMLPA